MKTTQELLAEAKSALAHHRSEADRLEKMIAGAEGKTPFSPTTAVCTGQCALCQVHHLVHAWGHLHCTCPSWTLSKTPWYCPVHGHMPKVSFVTMTATPVTTTIASTNISLGSSVTAGSLSWPVDSASCVVSA